MRLRPKLSFFVLTQTMNILITRKATLAMNIMITGTVGPQVIHNHKYNGIYLFYPLDIHQVPPNIIMNFDVGKKLNKFSKLGGGNLDKIQKTAVFFLGKPSHKRNYNLQLLQLTITSIYN